MIKRLPKSVLEATRNICGQLEHLPKLEEMFRACFTNTLETTTEILGDGTAYVFTGDIPALWLRDSSAQVHHYLPFAKDDKEMAFIIEGLLKRQMKYVLIDSYANAFNKEPNGKCCNKDVTKMSPWVWERKYEIDSLCYPVWLAYLYWKETKKISIFDSNTKKAINKILAVWKIEQKHSERSSYTFLRLIKGREYKVLYNNGEGMPVNYTGMSWSGFRPSDDAGTFGYNIPGNMFASVVLGYINEIAIHVYRDNDMAEESLDLKYEIERGINTYGIYNHPEYGKIYAYETDGFGNYNIMDDANVPSLLSIPYLGYVKAEDSVYTNTRRFVLSSDNSCFFKGKYAKGIGSPHTKKGNIWPIALIMQALTSIDNKEIRNILQMLLQTDGDTGYMHESFNPDNPKDFSRPWFAWANSLFAELIIRISKNTNFLREIK